MNKQSLAKQLQTNSLLWEVLADLDAEFHDAWTLAGDTETRETQWHLQRALGEVKEKLDDRIAELVRNDAEAKS